MTKLTLAGHAVLEALRKHLKLLQFQIEFVVPTFLLGDSLTQHFVGILDFFPLRAWETFTGTLYLHSATLLIMYGVHQLLVHFTIFFELLLGELQLLLEMLLLFGPFLFLLLDVRFVYLDNFFKLQLILSLQTINILFPLVFELFYVQISIILLICLTTVNHANLFN